MLDDGVYFLNYHSVGWEESPYTCGIPGYTLPVDTFRRHLRVLGKIGQLVSTSKAITALRKNSITEPLIALWFDDGHKGVYEWAAPEMERYGIKGALSVNSRFVKREELFWRSKLSYLSQLDLMRVVRGALRKAGMEVPLHVRLWSVRNFRPKLIKVLDEVIRDNINHRVIERGHDQFMNEKEVASLSEKGWMITNHTSNHYPIQDIGESLRSFRECDRFLGGIGCKGRRYWVVPFGWGYENELASSMVENANKTLVKVGNKTTRQSDLNDDSVIFRIAMKSTRAEDLKNRLEET